MASTRVGRGGDETVADDGVSNSSIADLLKKLNLKEEEEVVLDFSDDEGDVKISMVELAVVRKVLSPTTVHVHTVRAAMKPAWGTPAG